MPSTLLASGGAQECSFVHVYDQEKNVLFHRGSLGPVPLFMPSALEPWQHSCDHEVTGTQTEVSTVNMAEQESEKHLFLLMPGYGDTPRDPPASQFSGFGIRAVFSSAVKIKHFLSGDSKLGGICSLLPESRTHLRDPDQPSRKQDVGCWVHLPSRG